ncbi:two-component system response regulator [Lacisediminimonas profundi]|uniref:two-component system response regulator n=1 Tax=Lacisediminimonas profundi TaxID=2603856 RepID=UPI001F4F29EA|nr:EAL domain-containing protein [Lacisediminimonas profundi]
MQKPRVLLVNDHPASLLALHSLLERSAATHEYEIVTAPGGEQALRAVLNTCQQQFAVILLDVNMPGMDGFEVAEIIHSHPRTALVPIIFVTAHYADELHRLKGYQKGAVDYLFTPVIPQILQNKILVFVELAKKNLQLQQQTRQLEELNRDLQVQQMNDLKRVNAALEAEVIERRQAEERAHGLATRDGLTGLLNRCSLTEALEHAIGRAGRQGKSLAVLFLDMDRFKAINDMLGHDVGDGLLVEVAHRVTGAVRETDIVARLGGDEFVVLMESLPTYSDAAAVAHKIVQATNTTFDISGHCLKSSMSIGISLFPQDGKTAHALMKHADLAMYHAKQRRRGSVEFFHQELNQRLHDRLTLEHELQGALENEEFELHYQPKVDIGTGRVAGVEALLRWRHPRLGLITGAQFLGAAADSGHLVAIGEWVMSAACAQARLWLDANHGKIRLPIAVNVAIPQIHAELPGNIRENLRRHGIPAACLQLEITESLLIRDLEKATAVLQEISEAGITIAIDDFGTGYSSLSVLKALPIDILKIDQSFVRDLGKTGSDTAIVAAIVNMARALALRIVAEGVETQEQLNILRTLGCDEYQGFLHSRAMPPQSIATRVPQIAGV